MSKSPITASNKLRNSILNDILIHEPECDLSMYGEPCDCIQKNVADNIMQIITQSNQLVALEARIEETEHSAVQRSIDSGFGVSEYEAFMTVDAKKRRAELTQARYAMVKEEKS